MSLRRTSSMNSVVNSPRTEKTQKLREAFSAVGRLISVRNRPESPKIGESHLYEEDMVTSEHMYSVYTGSFEEHFEDELSVKVFKNSIRLSLIENMKTLGGNLSVKCLLDIENGDVFSEHFSGKYRSLTSKEKNLAFLWSSFVKRDDLLEPLLSLGADLLSTLPNEGLTALHLAAFSGCVKSCKWLISNGLELDLVVKHLSPLHCAILGHSLDCTKLLLSHGATIDNTVLHYAVQANATECLQHLLNANAKINAVDQNGLTALHVAADRGMDNCLQILVSHSPKPDLNVRTRWRKSTPLHYAAENGYFECCRLLIDGGADVNAVNHKRQTALHLAAKVQNTDCLEILLAAGCNVNAQDVDGRPPLHAAMANTSEALNALRLFLKRGADINRVDKYGYTPLHLAGLNELPQCVDYLILHGANVTARTLGGLSALSIIGRKTPSSISAICRKLDSSISMSDNKESKKEVELMFDFRYLLQNSSAGEVGFLKTLEKEGHKHLIEHPLCQAFLHLKWQKIRKFYLSRLLISFVFVILLTAYVIYALAHDCYNAAHNTATEECESCLNNVAAFSNATINMPSETGGICLNSDTRVSGGNVYISTKACEKCLTTSAIALRTTDVTWSQTLAASRLCLSNITDANCTRTVSNKTLEMCRNSFTKVNDAAKNILAEVSRLCSNNSTIDSFLVNHPNSITFTWYSLIFLVILKISRKIITLPGHRSMKHHVYQLRNVSEWFVIIGVFVVSYHWYDWTFDWQKNIGGVAVLLAWTEFMIIVGQLPIFGDYVAMFARVQAEFFKVLLAYSCLLVGFTVSFCVVFPSHPTFHYPLIGFIKILAMMTGELDFNMLNETGEASYFLRFSAHITYTLFVLFVTVVLMNLLVGIAVNDIQGLHKTAGLSKLVRQTELVYYFDLAICNGFVPKRMVRFLRQLAMVSPQGYRMVICVKPLHPREKTLPQDIMMAAYNFAKQKRTWNSTCCWSDTQKTCADSISHQVEEKLYEELRQLKEMIRAHVGTN